uniref:Uncharacterized protein n=1 Tax=Romanomermis culicivorax TaxID=13658 RepID=A0A915K857_ROMCU
MGLQRGSYSNNRALHQQQPPPVPALAPPTPAPAPQPSNDKILTINTLLGQLIDLLQKYQIASQTPAAPTAALQPP